MMRPFRKGEFQTTGLLFPGLRHVWAAVEIPSSPRVFNNVLRFRTGATVLAVLIADNDVFRQRPSFPHGCGPRCRLPRRAQKG